MDVHLIRPRLVPAALSRTARRGVAAPRARRRAPAAAAPDAPPLEQLARCLEGRARARRAACDPTLSATLRQYQAAEAALGALPQPPAGPAPAAGPPPPRLRAHARFMLDVLSRKLERAAPQLEAADDPQLRALLALTWGVVRGRRGELRPPARARPAARAAAESRCGALRGLDAWAAQQMAVLGEGRRLSTGANRWLTAVTHALSRCLTAEAGRAEALAVGLGHGAARDALVAELDALAALCSPRRADADAGAGRAVAGFEPLAWQPTDRGGWLQFTALCRGYAALRRRELDEELGP